MQPVLLQSCIIIIVHMSATLMHSYRNYFSMTFYCRICTCMQRDQTYVCTFATSLVGQQQPQQNEPDMFLYIVKKNKKKDKSCYIPSLFLHHVQSIPDDVCFDSKQRLSVEVFLAYLMHMSCPAFLFALRASRLRVSTSIKFAPVRVYRCSAGRLQELICVATRIALHEAFEISRL